MTASPLLSLPARLAEGAVRAYQLLASPVLGSNCRFHPSCSDYARQALRRHGLLRGLGLALWRIARCNPWNAGGFDPVPEPCGSHGHHHHDTRHHHPMTTTGTAQAIEK